MREHRVMSRSVLSLSVAVCQVFQQLRKPPGAVETLQKATALALRVLIIIAGGCACGEGRSSLCPSPAGASSPVSAPELASRSVFARGPCILISTRGPAGSVAWGRGPLFREEGLPLSAAATPSKLSRAVVLPLFLRLHPWGSVVLESSNRVFSPVRPVRKSHSTRVCGETPTLSPSSVARHGHVLPPRGAGSAAPSALSPWHRARVCTPAEPRIYLVSELIHLRGSGGQAHGCVLSCNRPDAGGAHVSCPTG